MGPHPPVLVLRRREDLGSTSSPGRCPALAGGRLPLEAGRDVAANPRLRSVLRALGIALLLLSISRSKQGKYLLFLYPFVAAVLALFVTRLRLADDEAAGARAAGRARRPRLPRRGRRRGGGRARYPVAVAEGSRRRRARALGRRAARSRRRRGARPPRPAAARDRPGGLRAGGGPLARRGRARGEGPAGDERPEDRAAALREASSRAWRTASRSLTRASASAATPLIVLDRRVEWIKTPEALLAWLAENPDGLGPHRGSAEFREVGRRESRPEGARRRATLSPRGTTRASS